MKTEKEFARSTPIDTLILLYDLHTKLFLNVIEDISHKDAQNRLHIKANHIAWLAGSLVHERYELANAAGINLKQTTYDLFHCHRGIEDKIIYPSLTEFKSDWEIITPVLRNALLQLSDKQLQSAEAYGIPGDELSLFDAITLL